MIEDHVGTAVEHVERVILPPRHIAEPAAKIADDDVVCGHAKSGVAQANAVAGGGLRFEREIRFFGL